MALGPTHRPENRSNVANRRRRVVELRAAKTKLIDIGPILRSEGYTVPAKYDEHAAFKDLQRALDQSRADLANTVDEYRTMELETLELYEREMLNVLQSEHPYMYQDTRVPGVSDVGPKLSAVDRLVKISQRRAKLLGLDQPSRVEMTSNVEYTLDLGNGLTDPEDATEST